jgi:hypothetical protein
LILFDAGQHVLGARIMAGAKQRNPGVRRTGGRETGTHLLRAGSNCQNERDNRARRFNDLRFPR